MCCESMWLECREEMTLKSMSLHSSLDKRELWEAGMLCIASKEATVNEAGDSFKSLYHSVEAKLVALLGMGKTFFSDLFPQIICLLIPQL